MTDTPKHSVSVTGIVVDDDDRVLVIQRRDNSHWEPPGGVLELDEAPADGTCREVREETGVSIEVEELSGVYKNMSRGIVALVFRCRPITGQPSPTSESKAVEWRPVSEVLEAMDPAYAVRITDAFDPAVRVRIHDGVDLLDDAGRSPRTTPRVTSEEGCLPAGNRRQ